MEKEKKNKKSGFLTRDGVAKMLGISVVSIDRYTKAGLLPYRKLKGRVLFSEAQVRKFLFDDTALPKVAKEQLDFILRKKVEQVDAYSKVARRYLGLKKILSLMDKLEKFEKDDSSESREAVREIKMKLELLMDDERRAEKEEREKMKQTLKEIKKEFE